MKSKSRTVSRFFNWLPVLTCIGLIFVILVVLTNVGLNSFTVHKARSADHVKSLHDDIKSLQDDIKNLIDEECPDISEMSARLDECVDSIVPLQQEIIAEQRRRPFEPLGFEQEGTGCYYSSTKVLMTIEAIFSYWARHVAPAYMLLSTDFDWARFEAGVQEYRYATTQAEKENYPALVAGKKLLQMIDSAAALPQTTDMERAQLLVARQEVNWTVTLYDLNFIHSTAATVNLHPTRDEQIIISVLPFFASEPDYDTKALLYMQRLLQAKLSLAQFYQDILTKDTPPQVESQAQCNSISPRINQMAVPDVRDPVCNAMSNPGLKAQCHAVSSALDTASVALATIYLGDYCAAATLHRPLNKPGLGNVHFGNETYAAWLLYMSGIDMSIDDRYTQALAAIDEGVAEATALVSSTYGLTFSEYAAANDDLNDERFTTCYDTLDQVTEHFQRASTNISNVLSQIVHYLPRTLLAIDSGGCCFYSSGTYDQYTNKWTSYGTFNYGPKGIDNGGRYCVDRFVHSITMHEGWTGHHLDVALSQQIKCQVDPLWTWFSGHTEGWGTYSELMCNETTTLCNAPGERINNLWWTTFGTGAVLKADIDINALGGTITDCISLYTSVGAAQYAGICTRSRSLPGQLAGYLQGSRRMAAARQRAESALGGAFDLPTFNMLITKFGVMPWSEMNKMVDAWIVWTQNRDAALEMPWGKTIDEVLFKSADPIVGTAFVIPDTGVVQTATAVQSAIAARIASDKKIAEFKEELESMRHSSRFIHNLLSQ